MTGLPGVNEPLLVIAVGGHALGAPREGSYRQERQQVKALRPCFAGLAEQGYRLLLVHGNGPQVGYLAQRAGSVDELDIHVAQSQGELGYLLSGALPEPNACLLTRVQVPADPGQPVKPVGPFLRDAHPHLPCRQYKNGWRVLVPSPRPEAVLEVEAARLLLGHGHLVAGGGGGIPLDAQGHPVSAVVDKDWVALELALTLQASALLFATNVDHVYTGHDMPHAKKHQVLDLVACDELLAGDELGAGSMRPKLEAASIFVRQTGQPAAIGLPQDIETMLAGHGGTQVVRARS